MRGRVPGGHGQPPQVFGVGVPAAVDQQRGEGRDEAGGVWLRPTRRRCRDGFTGMAAGRLTAAAGSASVEACLNI
jgi:hypothetical protein